VTEAAVDAPKIKHQINFNNLCIDTELSSDEEDDDLDIEIVHQKQQNLRSEAELEKIVNTHDSD